MPGYRVHDYGPLTLNTYIVFSGDLDDNCVANDRVQDRCHRPTLNPTLALRDHVRKARG